MKESLVCTAINLAGSSHRKPCCSACRRESFLLLSIATRPNCCKINPGINRVSEAAFTSDFILLSVRGSQPVVHKPLPGAVFQRCCSCGSCNWIPIRLPAQREKHEVLRQLGEAAHPCKRRPGKSKVWISLGVGLSSVLHPNTDLRVKRLPLLILHSCCHCSQSLSGMTKSSKRKKLWSGLLLTADTKRKQQGREEN